MPKNQITNQIPLFSDLTGSSLGHFGNAYKKCWNLVPVSLYI